MNTRKKCHHAYTTETINANSIALIKRANKQHNNFIVIMHHVNKVVWLVLFACVCVSAALSLFLLTVASKSICSLIVCGSYTKHYSGGELWARNKCRVKEHTTHIYIETTSMECNSNAREEKKASWSSVIL